MERISHRRTAAEEQRSWGAGETPLPPCPVALLQDSSAGRFSFLLMGQALAPVPEPPGWLGPPLLLWELAIRMDSFEV